MDEIQAWFVSQLNSASASLEEIKQKESPHLDSSTGIHCKSVVGCYEGGYAGDTAQRFANLLHHHTCKRVCYQVLLRWLLSKRV